MRLYEVTEQPLYDAGKLRIGQRGTQPHFGEEYEKHGQTSYWHTYGPAWIGQRQSLRKPGACQLRGSRRPLVRGTFCLSDDWRGASRSPER